MLNNIEDFALYMRWEAFGKEHAKKAKNLIRFGSPRHIRKLVNELRTRGVPICSGDSGYWHASTPEEIESCIRVLNAHVQETQRIISVLSSYDFEKEIIEMNQTKRKKRA